ncbi:mitochondrial import receptor subunit TOM70 [Sergentomyia squamirostris]
MFSCCRKDLLVLPYQEMSSGSTGSTFPRWQLAILLSAPVALTLGYLYYKRQSSVSENDERKKKFSKADKSVSIDGEEEKKVQNGPVKKEEPELTPLQQAMEAKNRGNEKYRLGKFDESIGFYGNAIDTCPHTNTTELATFYQNRAAAYEQLKQWSSVRDDCTKALELNPKYVKAYNRRAKANEHLQDLSNSLEDITATCILEQFQNQSSIAFADRVLRVLGAQHATEAMKEKKPVLPSKHFVQSFCEAFNSDPLKDVAVAASNPQGFMLAKIEFDRLNLDKVIPACSEELSNERSEFKHLTLLLRGTMYQLMGLFNEALEDFALLIGDSAVSAKIRVNALIKRASIHVQLDRIEECFEDFAEAEKIDLVNPDIYYHRGQMYVLLQRLQEALDDFEKTIKLVPDFGLGHVQKLYVEYRNVMMENPMKSFQLLEKFRETTDRFPKCGECYSIMAQILTEQQQYKEADQLFEKAIKMDQGNAALYVHRGILQLQWRGDVDTALQFLQEAITVDERCEFAFETLASIEVQRGNMDRAIELFDSAINLAKSETELRHLFSLKDAAMAQLNVAARMGIEASSLSALAASSLA